MKTYTPRPAEITRQWHVLDASGKVLGRLAAEAARLLRGKHKPIYTPHLDTGDFVVIINAAKVRVTGRKMEQKRYYRASGYPGGLRSLTLAEMLQRHPERVVELAVRRMLPRNALGRAQFRKLRVYAGPEHPHQAQVAAGATPALPRPPRRTEQSE